MIAWLAERPLALLAAIVAAIVLAVAVGVLVTHLAWAFEDRKRRQRASRVRTVDLTGARI